MKRVRTRLSGQKDAVLVTTCLGNLNLIAGRVVAGVDFAQGIHAIHHTADHVDGIFTGRDLAQVKPS